VTTHIVMYSGGMTSWGAAARVVEAYGTKDVILLFAETHMEDEDCYRFMHESAKGLGLEVTVLDEGRDIWQVFKDVRFLGNTRIDPCSRVLKRQFIRKWLEAHHDPLDTVIYLGYDWTEPHRIEKAERFWRPWRVLSPMADPPYVSKEELIEESRYLGMAPPRLYEMGFAHNNCGGGCVKAGIGSFAHLYEKMPERFAEWERKEQELRDLLGDVSILRSRKDWGVAPLPLSQLRKDIESRKPIDMLDIGGCACFEDPEEDEPT
jgi:hypothetical protein